MNHIKYIEFYDVRGAEASLRSLNGICLAGKHIKLEPGHPRNAIRWLLPLLFYFELHFLLFLVTSETFFYILNLPIFDISFVDEVFIYSLHIYSCYLVYYSCFLMVNRVKLFYYNVTDHTIMETLLL